MGRQYDAESLRGIGEQCINKLPPASAVQAMFLYEMQRETEAEKLFQGQMFELAKVQDRSDLNDKRVWDLEEQVKLLRKQATSREIQERIATSQVRTDDIAAKVKQQKQRLDDQGERLVIVEEGLKARDFNGYMRAVDQRLDKHTLLLDNFGHQLQCAKQAVEEITATTPADNTSEAAITEFKRALESCDSEIGTLYDERDAIADRLKAADKRIEELESLTSRLGEANINCSNERDALATRLGSTNKQMEELKAIIARLEKAESKRDHESECLAKSITRVDDRVTEVVMTGASVERDTNNDIQGLIARLQNTEVCNASLNTQLQIMQQQ
jgi:hypothetical protein